MSTIDQLRDAVAQAHQFREEVAADTGDVPFDTYPEGWDQALDLIDQLAAALDLDAPTYQVVYEPPREDDEESVGMALRCSRCGSAEVVGVDKAIRFNEYDGFENRPGIVMLSTSGDSQFDADGWHCVACGTDLADPADLEHLDVEYY